MLCSRVQNLLSAYADYELPGSEMLRIRGHLEDCPACARELAGIQQMKRLLGALPEVDAPPFRMDALAAAQPRPRLPRLAARWWAGLTEPLTGRRQALSYLAVGCAAGLAVTILATVPGSGARESARGRLPLELPAEEPAVAPPPPSYGGFGVSPVGLERVYHVPPRRSGYRPPPGWPATPGRQSTELNGP